MNTAIIILIVAIVYIFSVIIYASWVHVAYSKGGFKSNRPISSDDYFITFMPLINTAACLVWVFDNPRDYDATQKRRLKFYNIKRDNDDSKN